MVVLKFGGSSVGSLNRFINAVSIARYYVESGIPIVVVASALGGVTDELIGFLQGHTEGEDRKNGLSRSFYDRHLRQAEAVLSKASLGEFRVVLDAYLLELREWAGLAAPDSGTTARPLSRGAVRDHVLSMGERLSCRLFALALRDYGVASEPADATGFVLTDDAFGNARVDLPATRENIAAWYASLEPGVVAVVTGFIGATKTGQTTTLGRGGSDYSASLLATGLSAEKLERWTDVDGIYTSDPRRDKKARRLESIIMEDALSWNKAGKMGLHQKALDPLIQASIPMYVRSIDHPELPGTLIHPRQHRPSVWAAPVLLREFTRNPVPPPPFSSNSSSICAL